MNYPPQSIKSNYHNMNKNNDIPRARTINILLKDSSIIGNISSSLTGLQNLGNTCYINTCLQNLIHSTPFISKFLEISNKIFEKIPVQFRLLFMNYYYKYMTIIIMNKMIILILAIL